MGEVPTGNIQNGRTVLQIANLMADSESGSPVSYSSFLVTICLSRLVSEIFVCDGRTDRRTTQTVTAASPHIVAGQLINIHIMLTYLPTSSALGCVCI